MAENKPSEAAYRVAVDAVQMNPATRRDAAIVSHALAAVHDPARFEDPREVSVNLGAVVDALKTFSVFVPSENAPGAIREQATDFLLRRFGGDRG